MLERKMKEFDYTIHYYNGSKFIRSIGVYAGESVAVHFTFCKLFGGDRIAWLNPRTGQMECKNITERPEGSIGELIKKEGLLCV